MGGGEFGKGEQKLIVTFSDPTYIKARPCKRNRSWGKRALGTASLGLVQLPGGGSKKKEKIKKRRRSKRRKLKGRKRTKKR